MTDRLPRPDDTTPGTHGRTVVGLFEDRSDAEQTIRELKDAGFTDAQIGVAMQNRDEQKELMEATGSTAAEGAATGAVSGGVVGGLIGLLGSLFIPGVGPIVVGGVLASALTGAGIGAATGGLIGGLMGLGVPEADAQHFDQGIRSGGVLVTVDAGDRLPEVLGILQRNDVDLGPSEGERFRGADQASTASLRTTPVSREEVVIERLDIESEGQDTRSLGARAASVYRGKERRRRSETSYSGPERREAVL